jgi:putative phosphonate metabolism protein
MTETRYALYLAPPPSSPLHVTASALLGRDAAADRALPFLVPDGIAAERWQAITEEARGYGFHGTLKPPFRLASGTSATALEAAIADFAAGRAAFAGPPLVLRAISGFLALVPDVADPRIDALANDCVRHFDRFRAPPGESELARRRKAGLTPRQEEYLRRWGYPYVMEAFRLHFTLTCRLADDERAHVAAALRPHVEPFAGEPLCIDALALFVQPAAGAPFTLARRFPFGG